ncbi:MAG: hypothetical protein ABSD61_06210 [Terracidiphilus sp.]|jgi:hypothetical protein
MNKELLRKDIASYLAKKKANPVQFGNDIKERNERATYYRSWTPELLQRMSADEFAEYLSKLWAMSIWGNKQYVVDKVISDNGLPEVLRHLSDLVWSKMPLDHRWDTFRKTVKGIGPAMMSEVLCYVHPTKCMLWNRRAYVALNFLGVADLPRYNYQLTGQKYQDLCDTVEEIANEMQALGDKDANFFTVDYFIWDESSVAESLADIYKPQPALAPPANVDKVDKTTSEFIHDEVRDKIAEIGTWLGLQADTEKKVAGGAVVDAIWEATIGNMGRVIYVFEVQTKGSLDSLILNLLKSLNNPAVQGVVAVSDATQLEKIKGEVSGVSSLKDKLKYWNYVEVLEVYEALASVNEAINRLGLVPQSF